MTVQTLPGFIWRDCRRVMLTFLCLRLKGQPSRLIVLTVMITLWRGRRDPPFSQIFVLFRSFSVQGEKSYWRLILQTSRWWFLV